MDSSPRRGVVDEDEDGATLAAVVRKLMDGLSWSKARKLVRTGRVRVDEEPRFDPAERLGAGALVEIDPGAPRRRAPSLAAERLVHVDAGIVVVNKPAGLSTVPYDERDDPDTLIERTRLALRELAAREPGRRGESDRLGIVQRLDRDTTGLLVFARTRAARKGLESQFRAHSIHRRYVALVHGHARAKVHRSHLVADRGDGLRGSWRGSKPPKSAKRAITKVRVEEHLRTPMGEFTLISCQLETGRQHQIRIHLAESGHPLAGEQVYDRARKSRKLQLERPMLHAASLGFRHPLNHRPLRFEAPLPADFRAILDELRNEHSC